MELPLIYSSKRGRRREKAARALSIVGLGDRMQHKSNELSGGQQQKVAIARAVVNEPSIILADEPTGNLDSKSGSEIMKLFQRLNESGITLVVVTHEQFIADHAARVIRFRDGRVVEDRAVPERAVYSEEELRTLNSEELVSNRT